MVRIRNYAIEWDGAIRKKRSKMTAAELRSRIEAHHGLTHAEFREMCDYSERAFVYFLAGRPIPVRIELMLEALDHDGLTEVRRIWWRKQLTPDQLRLRLARLEGMSQRRLARIIGMGERKIRRMCQDDAGPVPRWMTVVMHMIEKNAKRIIPVSSEEIVSEDAGWIGVTRAAEIAGVSRQTVYSWISIFGIKTRKVPGKGREGYNTRVLWTDIREAMVARGYQVPTRLP